MKEDQRLWIVWKIDIFFAEDWKALQYSDTIASLFHECCFVGVEYDNSRSRVIAGNWQRGVRKRQCFGGIIDLV
jgi:hypothetical protein